MIDSIPGADRTVVAQLDGEALHHVRWRELTAAEHDAVVFFFFKQKTAYELDMRLEFRRVLFRSAGCGGRPPDPRGAGSGGRPPDPRKEERGMTALAGLARTHLAAAVPAAPGIDRD